MNTFVDASGTVVVLCEVLLSHDKKKHVHGVYSAWFNSVLMMYLDTYSLDRVSITTGSLDSTTSRSNLQSVWHCVSDSFRCFEGRKEDSKDTWRKLETLHSYGFKKNN